MFWSKTSFFLGFLSVFVLISINYVLMDTCSYLNRLFGHHLWRQKTPKVSKIYLCNNKQTTGNCNSICFPNTQNINIQLRTFRALCMSSQLIAHIEHLYNERRGRQGKGLLIYRLFSVDWFVDSKNCSCTEIAYSIIYVLCC